MILPNWLGSIYKDYFEIEYNVIRVFCLIFQLNQSNNIFNPKIAYNKNQKLLQHLSHINQAQKTNKQSQAYRSERKRATNECTLTLVMIDLDKYPLFTLIVDDPATHD